MTAEAQRAQRGNWRGLREGGGRADLCVLCAFVVKDRM